MELQSNVPVTFQINSIRLKSLFIYFNKLGMFPTLMGSKHYNGIVYRLYNILNLIAKLVLCATYMGTFVLVILPLHSFTLYLTSKPTYSTLNDLHKSVIVTNNYTTKFYNPIWMWGCIKRWGEGRRNAVLLDNLQMLMQGDNLPHCAWVLCFLWCLRMGKCHEGSIFVSAGYRLVSVL